MRRRHRHYHRLKRLYRLPGPWSSCCSWHQTASPRLTRCPTPLRDQNCELVRKPRTQPHRSVQTPLTAGAANPTPSPKGPPPPSRPRIRFSTSNTPAAAHTERASREWRKEAGEASTGKQHDDAPNVFATEIRSQRTPGVTAASGRVIAPQGNAAVDSRQHSLSCTSGPASQAEHTQRSPPIEGKAGGQAAPGQEISRPPQGKPRDDGSQAKRRRKQRKTKRKKRQG